MHELWKTERRAYKADREEFTKTLQTVQGSLELMRTGLESLMSTATNGVKTKVTKKNMRVKRVSYDPGTDTARKQKSRFEKLVTNNDSGQTTLPECVPRMVVSVKNEEMHEEVI